MKKSILSASPFILLILPVILFLGLSLAIDKETNKDEMVSGPAVKASTLVKAGEVSLIRFLLK
jgi:hypothetical protein